MKNFTNLTDALQVQPEEMDKLTLAELAELHNTLAGSKQKKARLQADIVASKIKQKKATTQEQLNAIMDKMDKEENEAELVPVENSVKPSIKKPIAKMKSKQDAKPETKKEEKPKAKATPKKSNKPKSLEDMNQEELLVYIQKMQEQQAKEIFPEVIDGEKIRFVQSKLETIKDMQNALIENPMSVYLYMDEKLDDDLTQFTVLFANSDVIVMLDRTRQKNTTITLKPEQLKDGHFTDKNGKFPIRFYIREVKEVKEEQAS